jgi:hypothetical protein
MLRITPRHQAMIVLLFYSLFASSSAAVAGTARSLLESSKSAHCRCVSLKRYISYELEAANTPQGPQDPCWPSQATWENLNSLVEGRLIASEPIALPCYPGPKENRTACDYIVASWSNADFYSTKPLGLMYPVNITCPPIDYKKDERSGSCTLGSNPWYAVNATTTEHIRHTIAFAKEHNMRLVTKSTGHDINGRSDGFGSLELWLRYHRNGIAFQPKYEATNGCQKSGWNNGAIKIDGAYQWQDVYDVAKHHNVIVVGGGSPSVGAVGGWATGGGHGPATRNYGMGADQILEVKALLADGRTIFANACENTDLYKAFRGGGPGYAVALSFIVKAHPNVEVIAVQRLEVSPVEGNVSALLDAVALLFQIYPAMNDAGYAGYGYWYLNSLRPIFGNTSIGYYHDFWNIGKSANEAKKAFAPMREVLEQLHDTVIISETYKEYTDYWSMYDSESGLHDTVGSEASLTSRLFDPGSVSDHNKVRDYVKTASGDVQDFTSNVVMLISGGKVAEDVKDPYTGLHPAWRTSPFVHIIGWGWAPGSSEQIKTYVRNNVTYVKGAAQKAIAPGTAGYLNEGDRLDPEWKSTFGANYDAHLATKHKYDPDNIFFCPVCVGSDEWLDVPESPLCRASTD